MNDREAVKQYYDDAPQSEWSRLELNPWEFLINCTFIDGYIRPGERVLDLGGGPGRYSIHLAKRGAEVTLVDLSDGNIGLAREKALAAGVSIEARQGDALDPASLPEGPFDHVLCMGPLYHLLVREERLRAIKNCLARLKRGGKLFAAFISIYSDMIYRLGRLDSWPEGILGIDATESERRYYSALKAGGEYAGEAFTRAYFTSPEGALSHFEGFPLKKLHFLGSEGLLAARRDWLSLTHEQRDAWLGLSLETCEMPALLSWSEHFLYIGEKTGRIDI
jgi:2-polyprenyl-3-methyl-5-hydroxy-6-metoxy-1,4-benzoquinol methylase